MPSDKLYLSIIIPAYNEENRLPQTLEQVFDFFENQSYTYEVIVIENGSNDRTLEIANDFAARFSQMRAFHEDQRGKGNAVRRGMREARGEYRFLCDADLSMPIEEVANFIPPALDNYDIAIGSREAQGSVRYEEPFYRHWGGRFINYIIQLFVLPGLNDTQCGFKMFRAEIADDIFHHQTFSGISFDPEILYIARLRGYKIIEVSINWYYNADTRINLLKDTFSLIGDLLVIRRNARQGLYERKK